MESDLPGNVVAALIEYQRMLKGEQLARREVARAHRRLKEAKENIQTAEKFQKHEAVRTAKALVDLDRMLLDGADGPHLMDYAEMELDSRRG